MKREKKQTGVILGVIHKIPTQVGGGRSYDESVWVCTGEGTQTW